VFYINVPVAAICAFFAWRMLASQETPTERRPVDFVGLGLLILFVGSLQIMLDKGKELDWFGSPVIVTLAVVAAIGFAAFLIWELTEPQPIVDLRVFRHRGFTGAVITIAITFGTFFATIIIGPLWLQTNMGYTATWAGLTTALGGVLAVVMSPIVPRLMRFLDARALVSFGVAGLGLVALMRAHFASNADYWVIAFTYLAQGYAIPFFFVPTTQIALSSVLPSETASAAGLSNFLRTLSAAFCGALSLTLWDNAGSRNHSDIAGALNDAAQTQAALVHQGLTPAQALGQLDAITQNQAVMLATDQMFYGMTLIFLLAACVVWLAPQPKLFASPLSAGGH
jgi:DHA2 family multidrug resistance protein